MKIRIATAWALAVLVVAGAWAQSSKNVKVNLDDPANQPAKSDPKSAPATGKVDPNKPAAKSDAKKKDDGKKKKEDEMGKIEGIEIARGGGFMGIQLVGGTFSLAFYDAKKKPVAPDVDRASLSWKVKYQSLPEKTVLNPSGNALTSGKVVKPPFTFSLSITLFKGEGDAAKTESFTVDFHT